ncbi:class I SAM-dependent methyltransferase [Catellatospora tritici]|uniref:class I SAM-dependent methyltransferase n=1 Tax=Catellatospora tritici TaxID=2851566 RepID=UPI001C2D378D|nr:class I SAM-dependent methyltransferase [Catellatospora tritici]MBV1850004.1 class I SAM-dependent methyltransferase [Catellatospora tritici]
MSRGPHSLSQVAEPDLAIRRAHWDRRAGTYDGDFLNAPIRSRVLDEIIRRLPSHKCRALDAGTGSGRTLARLIEHLDPHSELVATDISDAMLQEARARIQVAAPGTLAFVNADSAELPFPSGMFDIVLSTFTLHHVPSAQQLKVLREFRRVLKAGGILALADQVQTAPPLSPDDMRQEIAKVFYPDLAREAVDRKLSDYGEWSLQPAQLLSLLTAAGFEADMTLLVPIVAVVHARAAA